MNPELFCNAFYLYRQDTDFDPDFQSVLYFFRLINFQPMNFLLIVWTNTFFSSSHWTHNIYSAFFSFFFFCSPNYSNSIHDLLINKNYAIPMFQGRWLHVAELFFFFFFTHRPRTMFVVCLIFFCLFLIDTHKMLQFWFSFWFHCNLLIGSHVRILCYKSVVCYNFCTSSPQHIN